MTQQPNKRPTAAVGVVCLRGDEVLMIQRGRAPLKGHWSLPGGKIEWGERAADAALRELSEETGVQAELLGLIDVVDGLFLGEGESSHYVLVDYAARWIAGAPLAGDDAAQAVFVPVSELSPLDLWLETMRIILEAHARFGGAGDVGVKL
ncbi:MAG: NUDIX hydrolase [Caulobacteraceae bacterium]